jgi:hypothetical protein
VAVNGETAISPNGAEPMPTEAQADVNGTPPPAPEPIAVESPKEPE